MPDDAAPPVTATPACPWCSAPLPAAASVCPACGATVVAESEPQLPGVTAIDAEAIIRAARTPTPQRRNRLLSWISGEYADDEDETDAPPGSLAPPDAEVRREMLRLQLEAEVANLQAEAEAIIAEAGLEGREPDTEADTGATVEASSPETPEREAPEAAGDS